MANKNTKQHKKMKNTKQLQKIGNALQNLFKNDEFLLKEDANERTITHKLASHLQKEFQKYTVDVEYNRMKNRENDERTTKKIERIKQQTEKQEDCWGKIKPEDTNAKTIYPDIIVHQRNTNNNLIAIEIKKSNNSDKICDIAKLQGYKNQFNYDTTIFLKLKVNEEKTNTDYIAEAIEIKKENDEQPEDITTQMKSKI
ncbi:hypothetical protein [Methanonatronarchaeum sp. AMET-Sl]|uniref:hypothetical protein n=1 Tax=Methanonatronarchaeum sp. AMET-Sl TaxID=3037654 RepID=UPI00244E4562|nr:hypothetical protein [Methanonatronarchaeum sp. AMET-Sl]WGI17950.1 hypothetical protein QEN48_02800 [Methanonatronarchaeum sp. AMET-Sl]